MPRAPKIRGAAKCTFNTTDNADKNNASTCTYGYFTYKFATWEILGSYSDVNTDNGGRQLLRNVGNYVPIDTASYPRTPEYSITTRVSFVLGVP
jgi:hypothetical protein